MTQALLTVPRTAKRDDVVEVRALIAHPMESGYRPGNDGKTLPRNIITHVECRYLNQLVFSATLYPSVASNPYLSFHVRVAASGTVVVRWTGDNGFDHSERAQLDVV